MDMDDLSDLQDSDHAMSPLPSEMDPIVHSEDESCDRVHGLDGVADVDEHLDGVIDIDEHSNDGSESEPSAVAAVSMMDPTASELANAIPVSSQQVIGLLLQANEVRNVQYCTVPCYLG